MFLTQNTIVSLNLLIIIILYKATYHVFRNFTGERVSIVSDSTELQATNIATIAKVLWL